MRTMMKKMADYLLAQEDFVLVTVIAAHGATPRGAGARMMIGKEGRIYGTIGGGAIEYRSIELAKDCLAKKQSGIHDFTLNHNDIENLGMICGGDCNVFFHYVPAGDPDTLHVVQEAELNFQAGSNLWLINDLAAGGKLSLSTRENASEVIRPFLTRHPEWIRTDDINIFAEQIVNAGRVYIFGGGHVAQELEPMLTHVGFRCVVLEDRKEFARRDLFPTAEEIRLVDFEHLDQFLKLTNEDYVCVMTRGHAYDTAVQAQVLQMMPGYIGVIGSKHKAAGVRKALLTNYGLTEEQCDRVITPIGIEIGGETPAEIAVSIAAQLIAVRAGLPVKADPNF